MLKFNVEKFQHISVPNIDHEYPQSMLWIKNKNKIGLPQQTL